MEKMRFESVDGFQENIRRLADIFPSCVKEQKDNDGKTIRKVDINTLQLLLGINQKESETCEFSWVGKREAVKEVYKPVRCCLMFLRNYLMMVIPPITGRGFISP